MSEGLTVNPEQKEVASYRDVVIVRPPKTVPKPQIDRFVSGLSTKGFLPIIQPHVLTEWDSPDEKWFPTDDIREVGKSIFIRTRYGIADTLRALKPVLGEDKIREIQSREVKIPLNGGNYLHLNGKKIFVYAKDKAATGWREDTDAYREEQAYMEARMQDLRSQGWRIYPVIVGDRETDELQDLDFLLSVFDGKDGKVHAITSESYADRAPNDFVTHVISYEEAAKGGCNIADLRNGQILIVQNELDVPNTVAILNEHAAAEIIQTPQGFLDGGGGPRCSISSFSLS